MNNIDILIVDDEKSILDILISGLKDEGHNCFAALNAREALDIIKREKIQFSLLDIRLPDMSGIDLCAEIKKINPRIINVLMTGFPSIRSAVDGVKNGAFDYLVKPFRIEQILSIIENIDDEPSVLINSNDKDREVKALEEENRLLKDQINNLQSTSSERSASNNSFSKRKHGEISKVEKSYAKQSNSKYSIKKGTVKS